MEREKDLFLCIFLGGKTLSKFGEGENNLVSTDSFPFRFTFLFKILDATHGSLALKAYQQNLYLEYYY